ncbi:hypothetical protein CSC94_09630 [Zhengella mangrovi]|uniref:Uncharacterized protein n=1 Tax=Zhengella mangrovi TaxID=1982044 RepID=A0A2G1QP58_9HYPH|nr:hypothetical protein [Zhengella mangrovi]PHP67292.1 hypothetical protein CSC94_09630 [Zhengella mangrovi]
MTISSIGSSHRPMPERTKAEAGDATSKAANSVGHQAKAAIAAAGNPDLPSNIQGKVSSAIARGIDFTPLLAIDKTDPLPAGTNETPAGEPVSAEGASAGEEAGAVPASESPSAGETGATDDAQIAADLLAGSSTGGEET